ncbi:hypothetical protein [Blastococcus sp. VKM Ac-2987]|uniref:hypothetical protein n=1 Tax=Blastococcus sp. VKM Ac-2987 TaxID=3004141 RepID=UPI0022AB7A87|nr:hypothetical protein [Blastococcus sp. VKM Ac-2987]MCZ2858778.1 hypothetical protein [Blastococcus sp. VKM Ac-2987]
MRIRKIVLVAAAVTLPVGLSGCGGGSVEEFCAQYLATAEIEPRDGDEAQRVLESMADSVPDGADEVEDAVRYMADTFPDDADLEGAVAGGELGDEQLAEFLAAADTVSAYGDENCSG